MKGKRYLCPRGIKQKIAEYCQVSRGTVGKVLKGQIEGVCSDETAKKIYKAAPKFGAIRFFSPIPKDNR